MSFCIIRNLGIATPIRMPMQTDRMTTASTMIQPMPEPVCTTRMMPKMARMGA